MLFGKIIKIVINDVFCWIKKFGIIKLELEVFFCEIFDSKNKLGLVFCFDEEGLKIDGVIGIILVREGYLGFYSIIVNWYCLCKSKCFMVEEL